MSDDQFLFWTICLGSLFLGKVVSNYLFHNPAKFLEAYGGCDCGRNECKKIDEIISNGKRYTRVIQEDEEKMTYTYSRIYNATQGKWANDIGGEDDPKQIWADNDWEENDAIVGFFNTDDGGFSYNIIFCRPGYAVYIQAEITKKRIEYELNDKFHRIPPAILVNLNDTSDREMLHHKSYPTLNESDDDNSDSESSVSSSESEASSDSEDEKALCIENQNILNMLQKRYNDETNFFKKRAYSVAINDVRQTISPINIHMIINTDTYWNMGERMREKIANFIITGE